MPPVARGIKGKKMTWVCGLCITRSLMVCTPHQILFVDEGKKNQKGALGDLGVNGRVIFEGILKNYYGLGFE
jgi:hypothetical protein